MPQPSQLQCPKCGRNLFPVGPALDRVYGCLACSETWYLRDVASYLVVDPEQRDIAARMVEARRPDVEAPAGVSIVCSDCGEQGVGTSDTLGRFHVSCRGRGRWVLPASYAPSSYAPGRRAQRRLGRL